jgi:methyl-accepting chemotaxis protein
VQVVQETVTGSQAIQRSMNMVTEMTGRIREEIEREERNLEEVVASIESIQALSAQVKHANIEQNADAMDIEAQMRVFTQKLTTISEQARHLQVNSDQIVDAMQKLGGITESILQNTTTMSEHTIKHLVHQSEALREGLNVFKVT